MCIETYRHASLVERIQSFYGWKGKVEPETLAEAGFYYFGEGDNTRCFYCGVTIYEWEDYDEPIKEHLRCQENCRFAQLMEGVQRLKKLLQIKKGNLEQWNRLFNGQHPNLWLKKQQNDLNILHTTFLLLQIDYTFLI